MHDARRMGIVAATRYVLSISTNVILIVASACGYYFLAGVQTFGVEFVRQQYGVGQVLANLLMLLIGAGALIGVLVSGRLSDRLLRRGYLNSRILVTRRRGRGHHRGVHPGPSRSQRGDGPAVPA